MCVCFPRLEAFLILCSCPEESPITQYTSRTLHLRKLGSIFAVAFQSDRLTGCGHRDCHEQSVTHLPHTAAPTRPAHCPICLAFSKEDGWWVADEPPRKQRSALDIHMMRLKTCLKNSMRKTQQSYHFPPTQLAKLKFGNHKCQQKYETGDFSYITDRRKSI